jgi:large subunit ribosomal protein L7/L12
MDWQLIAIVLGTLVIGLILGRMSMGGGGEPRPERGPAPRPATPTREGGPHEVRLDDIGPNKIAVIKEARDWLQLGLKDAKDLVEAAPVTLAKGLSRADAESLARRITDAGGTVTVR